MTKIAGLISVDDYLAGHPEERRCELYIRSMTEKKQDVIAGFIQWTASQAYNWGGPWSGNCVLVQVSDGRKMPKLSTLAEMRASMLEWSTKSEWKLPEAIQKMTELPFDQKIELLTEIQRQNRQVKIDQDMANFEKTYMGDIHKENPIRIRLAGNDDYSQSRCYPTLEDAKRALGDIIKDPTFENLLGKHHFIFTN
jgi:hypothetical protein